MRKTFFLMLYILIFVTSCFEPVISVPFNAEVTIYNNSDYDVTELSLMGAYDGYPIELSNLRKGEYHNINIELSSAFYNKKLIHYESDITIEYKIDGKQFNVEHEEMALIDERGQYYSPQFLKEGSTARIYIKNESYELVVEGGGYEQYPWMSTPIGPSWAVKNETAVATVTVYNNSDYDVNNVTVFAGSKPKEEIPYTALIKKGAQHKFNLTFEKREDATTNQHIQYFINGVRYTVEHEEGAVYTERDAGRIYYSRKYLKDGAESHIYIKNNGYEIYIEGGGKEPTWKP